MTNTETTEIDFGGLRNANAWTDAKAWVEANLPQAQWEGVGYWRIPRVAHVHYGIGRVTVEMMRGHALTELAL